MQPRECLTTLQPAALVHGKRRQANRLAPPGWITAARQRGEGGGVAAHRVSAFGAWATRTASPLRGEAARQRG